MMIRDWLVPCGHCGRGTVVSLYDDGRLLVGGKDIYAECPCGDPGDCDGCEEES